MLLLLALLVAQAPATFDEAAPPGVNLDKAAHEVGRSRDVAAWLPTEKIAHAWQAIVSRTPFAP